MCIWQESVEVTDSIHRSCWPGDSPVLNLCWSWLFFVYKQCLCSFLHKTSLLQRKKKYLSNVIWIMFVTTAALQSCFCGYQAQRNMKPSSKLHQKKLERANPQQKIDFHYSFPYQERLLSHRHHTSLCKDPSFTENLISFLPQKLSWAASLNKPSANTVWFIHYYQIIFLLLTLKIIRDETHCKGSWSDSVLMMRKRNNYNSKLYQETAGTILPFS